LIEAAVLFKEEKMQDAQALLHKNAQSGDLSSHLALAQLVLKEGKEEECLASLSALGEDSFRLGVLATRLKLLQKLERTADCDTLLRDAIRHYTDKKDKAALSKLLASAGDFKFEQGDYEGASSYFEQLIELDRSNAQAYIPKLVIAKSHVDPAAAARFAESLPDVPPSEETIDVEQLENVSYRSTKESKTAAEEETTEAKAVERKKNKKKKKKRLPKNYNPNVAPDPERWLPRMQRSTYKKKKKKVMRGGHQGQDSGAEPAPAAKLAPTPTKAAPAKPAISNPGKGGKKGKKKGGRR